MVVVYALAGINHFINPAFYKAILPNYIPFHEFLIYLSGVIEIILALMLLKKSFRRISAYLIIAMLIVFMIVHLQMLFDFYKDSTKPFWMAVLRIPIQFVLIYWAYTFTKTKKAASK